MGKSHKLAKQQSPTREQLEAAADAERLRETKQVAAQPHRLGYTGDMADPLGRFVELHQCGRECWEAGWEYFRLVYRWRVATGVPVGLRLVEGETNNAGPNPGETFEDWQRRKNEMIHDWLKKIKRCENAMKCSGLPGFRAAQELVLDGIFPLPVIVGPVKRAIFQLAMELGRFSF